MIDQIKDSWTTSLSYSSPYIALKKHFISDTQNILEYVNNAFFHMQKALEPPRFRLFVNNGVRNDLAVYLLKQPFGSDDTVQSWVERELGAKKFCIAVNEISKYSDDLAEFIARQLTAPTVAEHGTLIGGFEAYLFAGCYDSTPFGIHEDSEHSLLLHLGPESQDILIWPRAKYKETYREPNISTLNFDVKGRKDTAISIRLAPGDLINIPQGDYHVFTREKYSVTLGLIPFPMTKAACAELAFKEHLSLLPRLNQDISYFSKTTDVGGTFTFDIEPVLMRHVTKLKSNGYLKVPPLLTDAVESLQDDEEFQCVDVFPLLHQINDKDSVVFVRGRTIKIDSLLGLEEVLKLIASGQPFTVSSIAAAVPDWDGELIVTVIKLFLKYKGVRKIV